MTPLRRASATAAMLAALGVALAACAPAATPAAAPAKSAATSPPAPTASAGAATVPYERGELKNPLEDHATLRVLLGATSSALVQSITATNALLFLDPAQTPYDTFQTRLDEANQALETLAVFAEATDQVAARFSPPSGRPVPPGTGLLLAPALLDFQVKGKDLSPDAVMAVLNTGKINKPISTLMKAYQVDAKRAQLILNNAMAGVTAQAYQDEAAVHDVLLRSATAIKESAALAVVIGTTYLSAGTAGVGMTEYLGAHPGAVISGVDAVIKTTKAGFELALGEDNPYTNNRVVSTVVGVSSLAADMVAVTSLIDVGSGVGRMYTAFKDRTVTTVQAIANARTIGQELLKDVGSRISDVVWVGGKVTDAVAAGEYKFGNLGVALHPGAWELYDRLSSASPPERQQAQQAMEARGLTPPPPAKQPQELLPKGAYKLQAAGQPGVKLVSSGLDPGVASAIGQGLPQGNVVAGVQPEVAAGLKAPAEPASARAAEPVAKPAPKDAAAAAPKEPAAKPAPVVQPSAVPATAVVAGPLEATGTFVVGMSDGTFRFRTDRAGGPVSGTWVSEYLEDGVLSGTYAGGENGAVGGTVSGTVKYYAEVEGDEGESETQLIRAPASGTWSGTLSPNGVGHGTVMLVIQLPNGTESFDGSWDVSGGAAAVAPAATSATSKATGPIGEYVGKKLADVAAGQKDKTAYVTEYEGVMVTIDVDATGSPYMVTNDGARTRLGKDGTLAEPFNPGARR